MNNLHCQSTILATSALTSGVMEQASATAELPLLDRALHFASGIRV